MKEFLSRRDFLKASGVTASAAALMTVLASCGEKEADNPSDDSNGQTNSNDTNSNVSNATGIGGSDTTSADSTAADTQSVIRDEVNIGIASDPTDFAPWAANSDGRTNGLWGIYQELAHMIDGEIYPILAKSTVLDDDGMGITFELFDYITDSEGNKITTSDVEFSFNTGKGLGFITSVAFVEAIEISSETTMHFTFNRTLRVGELDNLLRWFVVSQKAYEADSNGMSSNPVGTGPYVLDSYTANYMYTLAAREDYWQTDESMRHARDMANAKKINYYIIAESSQRTMALESGSIDMCSQVSNDDIDMFQEGGSASDKYWTYGVPDNLSCLVFCNCDSSRITSNVDLRKAIFYSINAASILQSVWNGNGTTQHSMCPAWGAGYVSDFDSETDSYYNYSVDTAKEYVTKSGYAGEELVILTEATTNIANAAQMVQSFMSAAGISAKITTVESTILQATYTDPTTWDVLLTQNACNTYAATSFQVFDKTRYTTDTINHIHDDKLQDLVAAALDMTTYGDDSLKEIHQYVLDNAYGMNIVNYITTYVVPKFMDTITLNYKKTFYPGGCTYNA